MIKIIWSKKFLTDMIKLPKGWTEETIGSKKVLKKTYQKIFILACFMALKLPKMSDLAGESLFYAFLSVT